jgi:hypothetical protein
MISRASRHQIAIVVGRTGSGKTRLIAELLGPDHERRITIDATGECRALYPNAYHVHGLADAYSAMQLWIERKITVWHLVAALQPDDVGRLVTRLCPVYDGRTGAIATALGGVSLECYELDAYMPVSGAGSELTGAWRNAFARGRHVGLSILGATQRPHQINRMATAQAHQVITFAMHEPNDMRWLRDVGGERFAKLARSLDKYHSAWYVTDSGVIEHRDQDYQVIRTIAPDETEL